MYDFGSFCYLDVQKTGSTFISDFLEKCSHEPLVLGRKHKSIRSHFMDFRYGVFGKKSNFRESVFYFNSVRHPFRYYASLYNYGCDGRGGLFNQIKRKGVAELYDGTISGFHDWLDFISNEKNAYLLGREYEVVGRLGVGFLSYRFVRLSIVNSQRKFRKLKSYSEFMSLYEQQNISNFTVLNESLNEGLMQLAEGYLKGSLDLDVAKRILNGNRINASKSKAVSKADVMSSPILDKLVRRDSVVLDKFYS